MMNKSKKKSFTIFSVILLFILFILSAYFIIKSISFKVSIDNEDLIGINGPVVIDFQTAMNHESVEREITISPDTEIKFVWKNETLFILPEKNFLAGVSYELSLAAGYESADGKVIRKSYSWNFYTREESLVFLHPTATDSKIWRMETGSSEAVQLSNNENEIYDYSISNSGNFILYSEKNQLGGYDLWRINRDGSETIRLINCGTDWCIEPDWSMLDDYIAFTRVSVGNETNNLEKHIWIMEMETSQSVSLLSNSSIQGEQPLWSPDDNYLAFFDPEIEFIHILDMQTKQITDFSAISGIIGSWVKDDNILLYIENTEDILTFNSILFEADPISGIRTESKIVDFVGNKILSKPLISPDGNWVLLSAKETAATGASQLWIVHKDGEFGQMITDDYLATHSAYSWNYAGTKLVYQSLQITASSNKPEIFVWDRECHICETQFADASFPKWNP